MDKILNVAIYKTTNGNDEYVQILSHDMEVNVVLFATKVKINDARPQPKKKKNQ